MWLLPWRSMWCAGGWLATSNCDQQARATPHLQDLCGYSWANVCRDEAGPDVESLALTFKVYIPGQGGALAGPLGDRPVFCGCKSQCTYTGTAESTGNERSHPEGELCRSIHPLLHRPTRVSMMRSGFLSSLGSQLLFSFPLWNVQQGLLARNLLVGPWRLGYSHSKQAYTCVIFLEGVSQLQADYLRGPSFQAFERYIFKWEGASFRVIQVGSVTVGLEIIWRVWSRRPSPSVVMFAC